MLPRFANAPSFALLLLALLAGCAPPMTRSELIANCLRGPAANLRVRACTDLIATGTLSEKELVRVYTERAEAYLDLVQYDNAIEDAERALRLDPNNVWAIIHRGTAHKRSRRYDQAIADFDLALRHLPSRPTGSDAMAAGAALGHRGAAYSFKYDYVRAIADYEESKRLIPQWWATHDGLCVSRAALGQLDQAMRDCEEALRLVSDRYRYSVIADRGYVHLKAGRYAEALRDFDDALSRQPRAADALYARGLTKRRLGMDPAGAEKDMSDAIRIKPWVREFFVRTGTDG